MQFSFFRVKDFLWMWYFVVNGNFVGNDKNAIITILSTRSRMQRDEICSKYEQKYNEVSLALKAQETYRNEFVFWFWSFQNAISCLLFS